VTQVLPFYPDLQEYLLHYILRLNGRFEISEGERIYSVPVDIVELLKSNLIAIGDLFKQLLLIIRRILRQLKGVEVICALKLRKG
jgi:hypothetical protein